jgi:hypothetical protein
LRYNFEFEGEKGKNFYIITTGSVYVLLKKRKYNDHGEAVDSVRPAADTANINYSSLTDEDLIEHDKRAWVEEHYPDFYIARVSYAGDSFGELGLDNSGNQ